MGRIPLYGTLAVPVEDSSLVSCYTHCMQLSLEPPYLIIKPGISEEEFYRLADEDSDWEYLDGRIVMHSPVSDRHENMFCFLLTLLRAYLLALSSKWICAVTGASLAIEAYVDDLEQLL